MVALLSHVLQDDGHE